MYYTVALFVFASCKDSNKESGKETKDADTTVVQKQADDITKIADSEVDYQKETTNEESAKKIQAFLLDNNKKDIENGSLTSNDRKFSFYEIDLNDDGKNEYFIQLSGQYFCGTGGCSYYLLNNDFTVNTYFSVTNPPVFKSSNVTNGWHDLILFGDYNQDGGVKNYTYLKFDKSKGSYPSNPSIVKKTDMAPNGHDFVMWQKEYSKAKQFTF